MTGPRLPRGLAAPRILATLADPELLELFCRAVSAPETLADADVRTRRGLRRLLADGVLRQTPGGYRADPEAFTRALAEVRGLLSRARGPVGSDDPDLNVLFRDGRLLEIPRNRSQRQRLLRWITRTRFEPRPYRESEVNDILGALADDYVSLRRYLVDEGFLERDPSIGEYRRIMPTMPPRWW